MSQLSASLRTIGDRKDWNMPERCGWAVTDPLLLAYHDEEWGVPSHDDRHLFEMLCLGGAQAGLSWSTILRKREGYRSAFANFEPAAVAGFDDRSVARLLGDPGVVRNRMKIESAVTNARAIQLVQEEFGSLEVYLWGFVGGSPKQNRWSTWEEIPAQTPESVSMGKELKRRGFRFVGPTICYAFMQAVGLVNDHTTSCFRYGELSRA